MNMNNFESPSLDKNLETLAEISAGQETNFQSVENEGEILKSLVINHEGTSDESERIYQEALEYIKSVDVGALEQRLHEMEDYFKNRNEGGLKNMAFLPYQHLDPTLKTQGNLLDIEAINSGMEVDEKEVETLFRGLVEIYNLLLDDIENRAPKEGGGWQQIVVKDLVDKLSTDPVSRVINKKMLTIYSNNALLGTMEPSPFEFQHAHQLIGLLKLVKAHLTEE